MYNSVLQYFKDGGTSMWGILIYFLGFIMAAILWILCMRRSFDKNIADEIMKILSTSNINAALQYCLEHSRNRFDFLIADNLILFMRGASQDEIKSNYEVLVSNIKWQFKKFSMILYFLTIIAPLILFIQGVFGFFSNQVILYKLGGLVYGLENNQIELWLAKVQIPFNAGCLASALTLLFSIIVILVFIKLRSAIISQTNYYFDQLSQYLYE